LRLGVHDLLDDGEQVKGAAREAVNAPSPRRRGRGRIASCEVRAGRCARRSPSRDKSWYSLRRVAAQAARRASARKCCAGRNIPFVKYGGLKFIEAAHVKDLLAILRWAKNPRDALAGFRVLQLLPGIGPASANKAMAHLGEHGFDLGELADFAPPDAAALSGRASAACCGVYAMPRLVPANQ
jgi:superfamily I DNA/RNA helicase